MARCRASYHTEVNIRKNEKTHNHPPGRLCVSWRFLQCSLSYATVRDNEHCLILNSTLERKIKMLTEWLVVLYFIGNYVEDAASEFEMRP